jgi:hypothetical protein
MKYTTNPKFILIVSIVVLVILTSCGRPAASTSGTAKPSGPPDSVEVVYFYKSNPPPCECLAEAGENIRETVTQEFKNEIESGKLKFLFVASDVAQNAAIVKKYDPAPFCLGMTIVHGQSQRIVFADEVWEYFTDKAKFKQALKQVITRALEGDY